jgi:urease accessory protein
MSVSADHLARLLQLASPTLPVGAYSYSQGLEWAIEAGTVVDARSAAQWIGDMLAGSFTTFEAPLWSRLYRAWTADDKVALAYWHGEFCAARETGELRDETMQMGHSLSRLAQELAVPGHAVLTTLAPVSFPLAHSFLAHAWSLPPREALATYVWSWLENLVLAAVKAVPLGQFAAQRMLLDLGSRLAALVDRAWDMQVDELCNFSPLFAIASSRHEAQYSRLFRS